MGAASLEGKGVGPAALALEGLEGKACELHI